MQPSERYQLLRPIEGTGGRLELVADRVNYRRRIRKNPDDLSYSHELHIYQELAHPSFPALCDAYRDSSGGHLIFEYFSGQTLEERIKEKGTLGDKEILGISLDLCDALIYLHSLKPAVFHLDVKPANIILRKGKKTGILDLGIAGQNWVDGGVKKTLMGTPGYAAPEQYREGPIDERADIYALGRTMLRMARGYADKRRLPHAHASGRVLAIAEKAASRDKGKRYRNLSAMRRDLLSAAKKSGVFRGRRGLGLAAVFGAVLFLLVSAASAEGFFERVRGEEIYGTKGGLKAASFAGVKIHPEETEDILIRDLLVKGVLDEKEEVFITPALLPGTLADSENEIRRRAGEGASPGKILSFYHALCHQYLIREEDLNEREYGRLPEVAEEALLYLREHFDGADEKEREEFLAEEKYFLECLIYCLKESDRPEDALLVKSCEKRIKDMEKSRDKEDRR